MSQNTGAGRGVLGAAAEERPWADASRPLTDRVEALLAAMTLNEKLAQLASVWIGAELGGGDGGAAEGSGHRHWTTMVPFMFVWIMQ